MKTKNNQSRQAIIYTAAGLFKEQVLNTALADIKRQCIKQELLFRSKENIYTAQMILEARMFFQNLVNVLIAGDNSARQRKKFCRLKLVSIK